MARDPYEILGIARDATLEEASAAYRRMAALYHPDRLRDFRQEVQDEGARHLREANEAIRALRVRLRGPLVAPGHQDDGEDGSAHGSQANSDAPSKPVLSRGGGQVPPSPSHTATAAEARVYYVDMQSVDAPEFHARWEGRHAAATLEALKHGHRLDEGPIKQIEWGTYMALLEGDATRRLLEGVLPGEDEWRHYPVTVVAIEATPEDTLPARLQDAGNTVPLGTLVEMLDDGTWYKVLADAY